MRFVAMKGRRGRVVVALVGSLLATVVAARSSAAQLPPGAGVGSFMGTLTYTSPGIPSDPNSCGAIVWTVASTGGTTPVINEPTTGGFVGLGGADYVGGLSFTGQDEPACESVWFGNGAIGSLTVSGDAPLVQGDTLSCSLGAAAPGPWFGGGYWIRIGLLMAIAAWGDCQVGDVNGAFLGFVIEGGWMPTTVPTGGTSITSAELSASWVASSIL